MKAVVFADRGLVVEERPRPAPGSGEALVRVSMAGICGTDVELFEGYYGFRGVAGHEFVGGVVEAPDAPQWVGRRTAAEINVGCGVCPRCRTGDPRHCPERRVVGIKNWDGAFAEYVRIPLANLRPVSDTLADDRAVFAEPLAAALEIAQQVHLTANLRLAVLGDGKLGLLAALALRHYCPGMVLIGRRESRLKIARERAVETVLSSREETPADLAARLGAFDVAVEASGRPDGIDYALALVRPEGLVAVKTTSHLPSRINLADLVVREVQLLGSRCGDIGLALDFLERGLLDPRPLVEAVYPFERFPEAFQAARRPGAGKVLLKFPTLEALDPAPA